MLHTQTVTPATLALIKSLCELHELKDFALVGGTNLALKFGHRLSIDIDLFTNKDFDPIKLGEAILKVIPNSEIRSTEKNTLKMIAQNVKLDIMTHDYTYINQPEVIDGIRFLSVPDIIAMKLGAVGSRGVKKDFWDIAELLEHYSLAQMIEFFQIKYPRHHIFHILQALNYFADADNNEDPISLKKQTWKKVKNKVIKSVEKYYKDNL